MVAAQRRLLSISRAFRSCSVNAEHLILAAEVSGLFLQSAGGQHRLS